MENNELISNLVNVIKKRIVVRTDESIRKPEDEARRILAECIPKEANLHGFLEFHGHVDIGKKLSALMREGRLKEMPALISDELLAVVAISQADGDLAIQIRKRYAGDLVQRVLFYESVSTDADEERMRAFVRRVRGEPGRGD